MNETIRARLVNWGHTVPIEHVSHAGIVLFGESSAWPRDVSLRLRPMAPGTKARLEDARQRHDWATDEIQLQYQARDGEMIFRGVDPDSLPSGTREIGLDIYDVIADRVHHVDVAKDGEAVLGQAGWSSAHHTNGHSR